MTETPTTAGKTRAASRRPRRQPVLHQERVPRRDPRGAGLSVPGAERRRAGIAPRDPRLDARLGAGVRRLREVRPRRALPRRRAAGDARSSGSWVSAFPRSTAASARPPKSTTAFSAKSARSTRRSPCTSAPISRSGARASSCSATEEQKQRYPAEVRERRVDRGVLSHGAGIRLRRAGHALDRRPERRRHALRAQRHEDLDLERGLRRHPHRVREGAGGGRRRAKGAGDRVRRRRARARRDSSASSRRRWASRRRTRAPSRSRTFACRSEDRLGDVGQGFRIALEILNSGRLGLAAGSARGTRRIMREAIAYAKQREQFGRPIGSFEIIQRKIATLAAECYALDSAVMVTAGMVDRGGIDFSLETAACKVFGSELAFRASNEALQIAGGIGYSKEYPVRAGGARLADQPDLRGDERGAACADRAHGTAAAGRAAQGVRHGLQGADPFARRHRRVSRGPGASADHEAAIHARAPGARARGGADRDARCTISRSGSRTRSCATARGSSTVSFCRSAWRTRRSTFTSRRRCCRGRRGRSSGWRSEDAAKAQLDCARIFIPMAYRRARRCIRAFGRTRTRVSRRLPRVVARGRESRPGDLICHPARPSCHPERGSPRSGQMRDLL